MIRALFVVFVILGGFTALALQRVHEAEPSAPPASLSARELGTALAAGAKQLERAGRRAASRKEDADPKPPGNASTSGRAADHDTKVEPVRGAGATGQTLSTGSATPTAATNTTLPKPDAQRTNPPHGRTATPSAKTQKTRGEEPPAAIDSTPAPSSPLQPGAAGDLSGRSEAGAGGTAIPAAAEHDTIATEIIEARAEFGSGFGVRTDPGRETSIALALDERNEAPTEAIEAWNAPSAEDPQRSADLIRRMLAVYRGRSR